MATAQFRAQCGDITEIQWHGGAANTVHVDFKTREGISKYFITHADQLIMRKEPIVLISVKKVGGFLSAMYLDLVVVARNQDALNWMNPPDGPYVQDWFGYMQPHRQDRLIELAIGLAKETRVLPVSDKDRIMTAEL